MALVVQQAELLTAQNILDTVSQDLRYQLSSSTSPDQQILLDYLNRVHMQLLRTSRWRFLLSPTYTFTTVAGITDYYIGVSGLPAGASDTGLALSNIGQIKRGSVTDQTNFLPLSWVSEKPVSQAMSVSQHPRFWRHDVSTPDVLNLYPAPDGAYQITFRYFSRPLQMSDPGQLVQVPLKYKDVLIAGTVEKGFVYLKKQEEVQYWAEEFKAGKMSIIRDQNLFPRGPEFISPDPVSQSRSSFGDSFFDTLWNK